MSKRAKAVFEFVFIVLVGTISSVVTCIAIRNASSYGTSESLLPTIISMLLIIILIIPNLVMYFVLWDFYEKSKYNSLALVEAYAVAECRKSGVTLTISQVLMAVASVSAPALKVDTGWSVIIVLVPAVLLFFNSVLIKLRVSDGIFGFNSLEGMEIVRFVRKQRSPPSGGSSRIFGYVQETEEEDTVPEKARTV